MTVSADIYKISDYVETIKNQFIDVSEETLAMGIFGYMSEINSSILQNAVVMISEYSNEAIPVLAKFEKNIITHALALGITDIQATPATMNVMLMIPEDYLISNMTNDVFTLDKDVKISIENFEFHIDYDIIITKVTLPTGDIAYTAIYDIDGTNKLSTITNPYLPPLGRIKITNLTLVAINCTIRQVEYNTIFKKILTNNPLENKIINFTFDSQLAYFDLDAVESGVTTHLTPIYDGLYDYSGGSYCNYSYMNTSTIRLSFNRDSYLPSLNCDVTINVYTTQGSSGNFSYSTDVMMDLTSSRFTYDNLFMIVKPISDSEYGIDKKSIDDLKAMIPKEALSRGSVTSYTDLNNFFNTINDDKGKLYFLEKIQNQIERSYYSYLILKNGDLVIPTNTIDVDIRKQDFNLVNYTNYVFKPGNVIYYQNSTANGVVKTSPTVTDIATLEGTGFVYMNPFISVINKSPFYISYYLNIMNTTKYLNFDFVNQNSKIQFIASSINWKREYFTDRNTYKLNIDLLQNINSDMGLITTDPVTGLITDCNIKLIGILYNSSGTAYKYCTASFVSYDSVNYIYSYEFDITTTDTFDDSSRILLDNVYGVGKTTIDPGYFGSNVKMDLYILTKYTTDGDREDLDSYVPNLTGYTLCNKYGVINGIDLFYDYSAVVSSYISVAKASNGVVNYTVKKMPLVRQTYMDTEAKIQYFITALEKRRSYIAYCLTVLEDSFGIDFKFFNTYGPSNLFQITTNTLINRTNLSLTFRTKLVLVTDLYILTNIKATIKTYVENINEDADIHMPNLITLITNTYSAQLVYFEFVDINGYGPGDQHVTQIANTATNITPEFLNINTKTDGTADITIIVAS